MFIFKPVGCVASLEVELGQCEDLRTPVERERI